MFRWLLNWLNPGRNPSNVFTGTPGGINGLTWEQAKEWADMGFEVGRVNTSKDWYVFRSGGKYYETSTHSDAARPYSPHPTDNMPVWYVRKESQK